MSSISELQQSAEYHALLETSQRLGSDPLLVQGPGGNTSIKHDEIMFIKASGTWLAHAKQQDIMVPVLLNELLQAVEAGNPKADQAINFVPKMHNPTELRPSVETTVHAVIPQPTVIHVHCVATIATAIRKDAQALLKQKLPDIKYIYIPYAKPGLNLARILQSKLEPDTQVIILGNHGLVCAGASVAETENTVLEVARRLQITAKPCIDAAPGLSSQLAESDYIPVHNTATHALALDPERLALAQAGTYYPDHIVFLGPAVTVAEAGETAAAAAQRIHQQRGYIPTLLLLPGLGAAILKSASAATHALADCLGDVLARIPTGVELVTLTPDQEADLLDWDAEKYRQALDIKND